MKTAVSHQVELRIPRRPEFVGCARNVAWTLAALQLGFPVSDADDVKLAVGEACTNAVRHVEQARCDDVLLRFTIHPDRLVVEIIDFGQGFDPECPDPDRAAADDVGAGLGLQVMRAVMDEVTVTSHPETGACVRMVKKRLETAG